LRSEKELETLALEFLAALASRNAAALIFEDGLDGLLMLVMEGGREEMLLLVVGSGSG